MSLLTDLISAWELNEASGNALDSHGSNDLTDNNTVGSGTGLVYGTARDFEKTNSEYQSIADNADVSTGDIDFTFEAWVQLESKVAGTLMHILGKDASGQREYGMGYDPDADRFYFVAHGASLVSAATFGAASLGTWYQVVGWNDATNNQVGIAINAGPADTVGTGGGPVADGTAGFRIGAREYSGFEDPWDGLIGPVRFWKRVLTSDERTQLYNAGAGLAYADFSPPTDFGLADEAMLFQHQLAW